MITGHGGNIFELSRRLGCDPADIIDMSSNINPMGPVPGLLEYLKSTISLATRLPEVDSREIMTCFAGFLGTDPERLLAGNGTTQFIYAIPQALKTRRALIAGPTYADYADACKLHGVSIFMLMATEADDFHPDLNRLEHRLADVDTVFLCNPNNPTGAMIPGAELAALCRRHPQTRFIIDESYLPFVDAWEKESLIQAGLENVIVLHSISKIFAIPGLRIGFLLASPATIRTINRYLHPWSVNGLAQSAVTYLAGHQSAVRQFVNHTRTYIRSQFNDFERRLVHSQRIKLYRAQTPFFLARLAHPVSAETVQEGLYSQKILIRNCSNFAGLCDRFIRIALKSRTANRTLAEELNVLVANTDVLELPPSINCPGRLG